jgi:hypothetical protein
MTDMQCVLAYGIGEFSKILTGMAEEFGDLSESLCISDGEVDNLNDEIAEDFSKPLILVLDGIGAILDRATAKIEEI